MEPLEAGTVAQLLMEIGQRTELAGDLPFKARAYYRAAASLRALTVPLAAIIAQGKLRKIPGVGEAIAEKILKLRDTGTHPTLERLRTEIPAGLLDMLRVPGLGPKKVAQIYKTLKIDNLAELEEACRTGRLKNCPGLGARMQAKILRGLEFMRKGTGWWLMDQAEDRLRAACEALAKAHPDWQKIVPAGPARRGCEIVDELCVVAQADSPAPAGGRCWETALIHHDIQVWVSGPAHYGLALLPATGSKAHLAALREHAAAEGFKLDANGLRQGRREVHCSDEKEIYGALRLPFIEPELREGREEIQRAAKKALPKLLREEDLRGILHSHSSYSDGIHTLLEMAEAVRALGYQYFGVADHSQTAAYAGGLKVAALREQRQEVERLNSGYAGKNFRIFAGVESDIRDDGALDYPDAVLQELDFVVASVHSRFNLDKQAQTERMLKAIHHPCTTMLGHLTGRLLLQREEYPVDVEAILKACAEHGVVVEVNANPYRLDLDWRWHQRALELGCMLSINPDAHTIGELDFVRWGVKVARKGGVPPERVLNCLDLAGLTKFLEQRKKRR